MFAGALMMGASDRLLPPSVPFRFFATAVVMQVAAWAMLAWGADGVTGFVGGLGPGLAALHLVTLGVLVMTAMGAAFQMLPVATRRQLGPVWACRLTWWLYAPGVAVLSVGMAMVWPWALHLGGALTVAGMAVFAVLVARNLRQVNDLKGVTNHVWLALASLVALAVLGLALVLDVGHGFLNDRAALGAAHAILAAYGFMGSLALGFSHVLIPMFALADPAPEQDGVRSMRLMAVSLVVAVSGVLAGLPLLAALGGLVGLIAAGMHLRSMLAVLAKRMRKVLERFFRLVYLAWIMLPVSVVAGIAVALGDRPEITGPLWGWFLVFGWLLTFVTAILQRIMPFLASMHSAARGGKPVLLSKLVAERPLLAHALLHGAALVLVGLGLLAQSPRLVLSGAVAGLVGALSFLSFAALVMTRLRAHGRAQSLKSPKEAPSC